MITLTIDGLQTSVEEGTTLLEAAKSLGVPVPTLCYHKALTPYGACRLCLVEVEQGGRTSIQTSCNYPAREGLTVRTSTERVIRTRKLMAELLLARCPDSENIKRIAEELGVTGRGSSPRTRIASSAACA